MLRGIVDQFVLTWRLLRDSRVPFWLKLIPFAEILYILSPLDFIPDVFIGIGQLDDLGILIGGMRLFEALAPAYVVAEHRDAIARRGKPLEIVDTPNYRISHPDDDQSA